MQQPGWHSRSCWGTIQWTGQFIVKGTVLTAGIPQNDSSGACPPPQTLNIITKSPKAFLEEGVQRQIFTASCSCALRASTTPCQYLTAFPEHESESSASSSPPKHPVYQRCKSYAPHFCETAVPQQRQPEMIPRRKSWHRSFDSLLPLCCTATSIPTWQLKW